MIGIPTPTVSPGRGVTSLMEMRDVARAVVNRLVVVAVLPAAIAERPRSLGRRPETAPEGPACGSARR